MRDIYEGQSGEERIKAIGAGEGYQLWIDDYCVLGLTFAKENQTLERAILSIIVDNLKHKQDRVPDAKVGQVVVYLQEALQWLS